MNIKQSQNIITLTIIFWKIILHCLLQFLTLITLKEGGMNLNRHIHYWKSDKIIIKRRKINKIKIVCKYRVKNQNGEYLNIMIQLKELKGRF